MRGVSLERFILTYLFIGLIFFDLTNGLLVEIGAISEGGLASPSQVGRLLALMLIVFSFFLNKWPVHQFIFCSYFLLVEIFAGIIYPYLDGAFYGIMVSYKIIYLIILLIYFDNLKSNTEFLPFITSLLKINVLLVVSCVIFSFVTGYGVSTYHYGSGTKSYFASGNGLGVYLGASALILRSAHHKVYGSRLNSFFILLPALALLLVGTKTSVIFALALLSTFVSSARYFVIAATAFLLLIVIFGTFFSSVLLGIFQVVLARYENSESLWTFLASGRDGYVTNAVETYFGQGLGVYRFLFGGGAVLSYQFPSSVVAYDTLETDPFDVFFSYGAFGLLMYLLFSVFLLFQSHRVGLLLPAFLLMSHSVAAGHVLFNGMSVFLVAVCYFYAASFSMFRGEYSHGKMRST